MKRFSKAFSTVLLVALIAISLIGCSSTVKVEEAPQIVAPVAAPAKEAPAPAPVPAPEPAPVVEEPAPAPVVEKPAPAPVVEEPAPVVEEKAPVVEEPVAEISIPAPEPEVVYPFGVKPIVKNAQGDKDFDLFIVHTNDVHARITEGTDGSIGYSKFSTLLKMARSITDNILLLDAGDVTHGTNLANYFQGETVGVLLDMLGYDAVAPGNHDYNYGSERLIEAAKFANLYSNLKVLSANVLDAEGNLVFQPYQIYDFNGFKVCVIGLTTPDTKYKSHPKNTEGLTFDSEVIMNYAQTAIDMAHQYADYVVVLGHIGLDPDSTITSDYICENVKGIDLFVDGHSHSVLPEGKKVGDSLIVSTGEYLKNIGVVNVVVKDLKVAGEYPFLISADDVLNPANSELAKSVGLNLTEIPNDPQVDAYVAEMTEELNAKLNVVVANIPSKLDGERANVRTKKTNLSDLIAKAMTEASGADFSITNGGGIRASLNKGEVTLGDIVNVLPFTNTLTVCEITGQGVYDALEFGYRLLPATNGGFPQTDLQVVYSKYAEPGNRIKRVLINGKLIDKNATYKVATNDFMAAGGDGYTMFGKVIQEGKVLNEVFAEYLTAHYPAK